MQYDDSILDQRFSKLPQELQQALTSTQFAEGVRSVSEAYGLHVDQEGVLFNLTAYILLGLIPSSEFVDRFSKEADMDEETAKDIANDLNSEVFDKVRSSMQFIQKSVDDQSATPASDARREAAALEKAGGFSVEPSLASSSADGEEPAADSSEIHETDKDDILAGIENPTPAPSTTSQKPEEAHVEPLVDHLLGTSSAQKEKVVVHKTEEPPANLPVREEMPIPAQGEAPIPLQPKTKPTTPRPAPAPRKGPDPYREIFN